jgi:hypothetical protein
MRNEDPVRLRQLAHEAIRSGKLPGRPPDFMWGGIGEGSHCAVCWAEVHESDTEVELAFEGGGTYRMHARCHRAWESVVRDLPVELPPAGTDPIIGDREHQTSTRRSG